MFMKLNLRIGKIGALLSVSRCSRGLKDELIRAFTFDNPAYLQAARFTPWDNVSPKIPRHLVFAREEGAAVLFPRGIIPNEQLSYEKQLEFNKIDWTDKTCSAPVSFPPLKIKLNAEQEELLAGYRKAIKKQTHPFRSYLFVAPTSAGKSIFLAALARELRERVLVLCPTDLIMRSWKADLIKAFGFSEKEIGVIRQKSWHIADHITLASPQTLIRRKHLWPDLFKVIGALYCDEGHTISAPTVREIVFSFPAKYVVGVTATDRNDKGKNHYVRSCFGNPVKRLFAKGVDTETSMVLRRVEVVPTGFAYPYRIFELDLHDLIQCLAADEDRNNLIVSSVKRQWKAGHNPLLVTKSVAHVHLLCDMLREAGVKDAHMLTGETNTNRKYTEKLVQQIFSGEVRCVVASIQAIKLGANLNPLDQLHLGMPVANKKDLEQLIGRVRRRWKNKTDCAVYYYFDQQVPYLKNLYGRIGVPVFRKMKVPSYQNLVVA